MHTILISAYLMFCVISFTWYSLSLWICIDFMQCRDRNHTVQKQKWECLISSQEKSEWVNIWESSNTSMRSSVLCSYSVLCVEQHIWLYRSLMRYKSLTEWIDCLYSLLQSLPSLTAVTFLLMNWSASESTILDFPELSSVKIVLFSSIDHVCIWEMLSVSVLDLD